MPSRRWRRGSVGPPVAARASPGLVETVLLAEVGACVSQYSGTMSMSCVDSDWGPKLHHYNHDDRRVRVGLIGSESAQSSWSAVTCTSKFTSNSNCPDWLITPRPLRSGSAFNCRTACFRVRTRTKGPTTSAGGGETNLGDGSPSHAGPYNFKGCLAINRADSDSEGPHGHLSQPGI